MEMGLTIGVNCSFECLNCSSFCRRTPWNPLNDPLEVPGPQFDKQCGSGQSEEVRYGTKRAVFLCPLALYPVPGWGVCGWGGVVGEVGEVGVDAGR